MDVSVGKIRKAVAGAVAAAVVTAVARWVDLDVAAIEVVVEGLLVGFTVWVFKNDSVNDA